MSLAVGIDLGTTNTVVAAVRDGVAFTIADPNGRRLIPSTVSFHPSGNVLVGQAAIDRRLIDPENTVYSVKRLIGRGFQTDEVQKARARFAFKMKEGPKSGTIVVARDEEYTLPEISAFVLRYAKATAEAALGVPVDRAVITVPANFNDLQRAATKVAGKLAGLDVLRILNEPTAAALAYGQGAGEQGRLVPNANTGERVAVYDLGGGTFDITLLDLSGNVFEVLATAGDTSLGGDDFDNLIAERMAEELLKKHRYDARTNPTAIGTLRMVAESMKRELSSREDTSVQLNDLAFGEGGRPLPFSFRMTRPELEWTALALVDRTFAVCQSALERANLRIDQINRVILVGGSTRMPLVARRVEQFWKQQPVMRVNPDEVVALGAAIQAGALDRQGMRRRAPGAPAPAAAPTTAPNIAEDSIVAPLPLRPASALRDDEPMLTLPLVTGATGDSRQAARGATQPLVRRHDPRSDEEESTAVGEREGLPIVGSVGRMKAPPPAQTQIEPDPILPIGVGNLDLELPAPERHEDSGMGRPLVFDLPPSRPPPPARADARAPQRAVAPPPPRPPAQMDPPTPYMAFTPATATHAMPSVAEPAPKPPLLIDVTPLSLSVETVGGFCDQLIDANTPVPCDRTRVFLTASDNQTAVFIRVAQGESKKFGENTFLGELELSGLAPQRRGELQIAVTFEIDADGILNVRAKDVKAGRETKARMHLFGAQTEDHEIEAMRARQARHAVDAPAPAGAPVGR